MTKKQLEQDVKFLSERQFYAGVTRLDGYRETGLSSNSIVSIAYGIWPIEKQIFPSDMSDMEACENMWRKMPEHRKNGNGLKAMQAARNSIRFR